jgi:hypothetical protein
VKSAFLLSDDPTLFGQVVAALHDVSPEQVEASAQFVAQIRDDADRLFTVYSDVSPGCEWEYREGPFVLAYPEMRLPDFASVTACVIECRWEDLFVAHVRRIADRLSQPAWVLDSDGVVWPADNVNPHRVLL